MLEAWRRFWSGSGPETEAVQSGAQRRVEHAGIGDLVGNLTMMQDDEPTDFVTQLAERLVSQNLGEGVFPLGIPGIGNQRNSVVGYAALARAATIISSVCAQMMCNGMTVRDRDDRKIDNRRTRQILDVIGRTPDGGDTAGLNFIEDCVLDYCLDGNSLIVPSFNMSGLLSGMVRYRSYDAHIVYGPDRRRMYQLLRADNDNEGSEYFAARDVMHVRWPRLLRYGLTTNSREEFALAPVVILSQALGIGIRADQFVNTWFEDGSKPGLHVNIRTRPDEPTLTAAQRTEVAKEIRKAVKSKEALVTFDGESSVIDTTAQSRATKELRDFQVEEVARLYGLPLPLLSVSIRQWGAAVNEQIMKLAWRTGFKPHLDRFLMPFALKLLQPGERFEVDPTEFVRGDTEGMTKLVMAVQGDAQRAPIATREETRHLVGLPREAEGNFIDPPMPANPPDPGD